MADHNGPADPALRAMEKAADGGLVLSAKPWETDLFRRPVFSLTWPHGADEDRRGWTKLLRELLHALKPLAPVMITARVDTLAVDALDAMRRNDFRLLECYLTLSHDLETALAADDDVRAFQEADLAALTDIAARSFELDRFHIDPDLPRDLADRSRVEWVANGCRGRAEAVYVTGAPGAASGFVLCAGSRAADAPAVGRLDLMGVDPAQRRRGRGRALTRAFLAHCRDRGYAQGVVGTQAHNTRSLRLYEAEGFRVAESHYSLHRHIL